MLAAGMVCILVILEWYFDFDFSLGILYIFPVMLAATVLTRGQILLAAIFCAYTRGLFTADETHLEHMLRFCMATIAYSGCGLLIYEISNSRRIVLTHYAHLRLEKKRRRSAEEQLRLLANSSPAAILTVSVQGKIVAANHAAYSMFSPKTDKSLLGLSIRDFVPLLDDALHLSPEVGPVSTSTTTWACRAEGEHFPVTAWFSIYGEGEQRHLAAIVVDVSNEVREREHAQFEALVHHNRVLTGAVSHEIRNLCSAIAVASSNLARSVPLAGHPDFDALSSLITGLRNLASFDLRKQRGVRHEPVSLASLADELRIIIGQDWEEIDGELCWHIPSDFPSVRADRHGLLQVLLNLSQNALRAVEDTATRRLTIEAVQDGTRASVRVYDTGPGIALPEQLFQPFHSGTSGGSGLGLYVSRAIMKSFGGQLQHVPTAGGCCFEMTLLLAATAEPHLEEVSRLTA